MPDAEQAVEKAAKDDEKAAEKVAKLLAKAAAHGPELPKNATPSSERPT